MLDISKIVHDYATHPLLLGGLIVLLVLYRMVARRSKALPNIPVGLIIIYLLLELVTTVLEPYDIGKWGKYLDVASTIALYSVVMRFAVAAIMEVWLAKMRKVPLPSITRDFILAVSFIIIVLWVLRTVGGINLTSLLTTSAILTAVIGLALQDTLGSFFAGLSLQIERPYQIGDWIFCKGYEGKVVGIGWRTTRVRTRFGEMIYIPNNEITKDTIKNFSQPEETHITWIEVGVEYGAPPNKVRQVILDAIKKHPNVVPEFKSTVRLMEFSDFSVNYKIFLKLSDLNNWYLHLSQVRDLIWYALRRNGIRIPFPIRDVNLRQVDAAKEREDQLAWIAKSLRRIPVLKPLSDDDVKQLASGVDVQLYGVDEEVVVQGDVGDSMYLIQTGTCDVIVEKPGTYSRRVATLSGGNFFGEMSLLTGEKRTATVRAQEDSMLISIGKQAFQEMLESHPEVSHGLAEALAHRQAELDQMAKEKNVVERNTRTFLERIKNVFGLTT